MQIKNFSSIVDENESIALTEQCLAEIGANYIERIYKNDQCTGLTFIFLDKQLNQRVTFYITAQIDECRKIFWERRVKRNPQTWKACDKQSTRTAWKILSDWTQLQCSIILLGRSTPLQMFLPCVYDVAKDETLYEKMIAGKINHPINY